MDEQQIKARIQTKGLNRIIQPPAPPQQPTFLVLLQCSALVTSLEQSQSLFSCVQKQQGNKSNAATTCRRKEGLIRRLPQVVSHQLSRDHFELKLTVLKPSADAPPGRDIKIKEKM